MRFARLIHRPVRVLGGPAARAACGGNLSLLSQGGCWMLRTLLIAAIALLATWALLVVAAKRLPPGILKDLAGFLPACLTTIRRLRNDPRVPRRAKVAILLAGLWLLSPIDLLPEFLPVIGPLDDVLVVALALRYAARSVPRPILLDAWPADPRLLERLLGPPATPTHATG
jgi:uncharacterized membrane protein YkvA (DUF1232 family)